MNRRQTLQRIGYGLLFLCAGVSDALMTGCAAGALPWITMGLNLFATVLPTIPSLIAAISGLAGHNVLTPTQVAKLTSVLLGVQNLFQQAEADLNQFQTNNDPTLVAKIEDILNQVKTSLSGVLADLQITDPATVIKITGIVNSFVGLADDLLAILPTVVNGKLVARKPSHAQLEVVTPAGWSQRFNAAIHIPTGNVLVDNAFNKVVAVPKTK